MDAQNAESDQTRPEPGASSPRPRRDSAAGSKSPTSVRASPPSKDSKPKLDAPSKKTTGDLSDDRDSDAETIVLPGKDGHSPSKARKVRQEDKSDGDSDTVKKVNASGAMHKAGDGKAKDEDAPRKQDGSSGLSSVPTSPPQSQRRRRRSEVSRSSSPDPDRLPTSSKSASRDQLKSGERLPSNKRKATKPDSDDDEGNRKARRQRTSSTGVDAGRKDKDAKSKAHADGPSSPKSPSQRQHRRSMSLQMASQHSNGLAQKKKRLPPPIEAPNYHSDDSEESASPRPRSSKLRSLAAPTNAETNASPVKVAPHKKHLDAHGQTLLARACARAEFDVAKQRLGERPEDLNVADYAGNTPLQIAAINGCEDIVKLLIDAGCNLDCVNYDKDTPLLDAVDNGHFGVIKLLLDAGVNPRKANVNGEEPIDRVSDDMDNADEIRAALKEARKRAGERRRTSEDRQSHQEYHDARESHAPDSPRHSPSNPISAVPARRGGTVRATKTRNDLLYMPLDEKTLRQAAGRGDEETVARILQVKEGFDDPESMVSAARGGHDLVIQLLLGLGGFNPDPAPAPALQAEFGTPILAAIGQENIKVIELLLEQQSFDPTRRFKGETYYEIARRRQGTNWKEEEQILKNAYDEYKRSHKDGSRTKSTPDKRARRAEGKGEQRSHKRNLSSPTRETEPRKKVTSSKLSSPRDMKRADSLATVGDEQKQKRAAARHKKEERNSSVTASDRELSPTLSHKALKTKMSDQDPAGGSSEGESFKPRRKLVSKGELRGERDKQRQPSMTSNPSSAKDTRRREDTKDRPPNDGTTKRHRTSLTPDQKTSGDKPESELPTKRRRLDQDGKRQRRASLTEGVTSKSASREDADRSHAKRTQKAADDDSRATGPSIHVKSEEVDVEMPDVNHAKLPASQVEADPGRTTTDEPEEKAKALLKIQEAEKEERDKKAAEEEERAKEEAERKRQEEERRAKEEAEKEAERLRMEEEARKKREEEDRLKREAEEKARREEEEKQRLAEEKRQKEEEERKKREEAERLQREQLEREAAEEARRKREEEERKERERRERAHREEVERKRAAREAEQRRIREEQERARLEKLPPLLQWLDQHPNPKTHAIADTLRVVQGVRFDTIRPQFNKTPEGRELWLLNIDVALLLGEKDLDLSRYTAWDRVPAPLVAKKSILWTQHGRFSMIKANYWDLGRQVPGIYGGRDPKDMDTEDRERGLKKTQEQFKNLDMFFVKVSDFMYTVPNIPHLRNVKLAVEYREVAETEEQYAAGPGGSRWDKWKDDPEYAGRFISPRYRYWRNGEYLGETQPGKTQISPTPFEHLRVPRKYGLLAVPPDDPDYDRLCREQGLDHLVQARLKREQQLHQQRQPQQGLYLLNGLHSAASASGHLPNGSKGDHGMSGANTSDSGVKTNGI